MATAALISTVASAGVSVHNAREQKQASKDAERAQRAAANIEKRKAAIQNARERRKATAERNMMVARNQASQAAASFGSSSFDNTNSAIVSQTAGNIGFQSQMEGLNARQIDFGNMAARYQSEGQRHGIMAAMPGNLGLGFGSMISNFDNMSNSFKSIGNRLFG